VNTLQVLIDVTDADFDLETDELERLTANLAQEINEIVEDVERVRESEIPDGSKSALAGFIPGMLNTVVNPKKAKELLDSVGNRFYGKTLKLEYEDNGAKYAIEYNNQEQLENALSAIERLSKIKVSVTKTDG
jgi:ABC-type transport system substrate-binding protein